MRERGGDKHRCVVASHTSPAGDPASNPGMCSDWESNQRLLGPQASAQSTEPHQPGHSPSFISTNKDTECSSSFPKAM